MKFQAYTSDDLTIHLTLDTVLDLPAGEGRDWTVRHSIILEAAALLWQQIKDDKVGPTRLEIACILANTGPDTLLDNVDMTAYSDPETGRTFVDVTFLPRSPVMTAATYAYLGGERCPACASMQVKLSGLPESGPVDGLIWGRRQSKRCERCGAWWSEATMVSHYTDLDVPGGTTLGSLVE